MKESQGFNNLLSGTAAAVDATVRADLEKPYRICLVYPHTEGTDDSQRFAVHLGSLLTEPGQSVTCLLPNSAAFEDKNSALFRQLQQRNIDLAFLPKPMSERTGGTLDQIRAYEVYKWLKPRKFDLVHFPDRFGLGYYTLLAKHQGLNFQYTTFCINLQGPSAWIRNGDAQQIRNTNDLIVDFMERECIAMANVVIVPNEAPLLWMQKHQWRFPESTLIRHNPFASEALPEAVRGKLELTLTAPPGSVNISEIVFYEDLSRRKGLELVCNVVDRLAAVQRSPIKITFLGKVGRMGSLTSDEYVEERANSWALPWQIISDFTDEQAINYLLSENRLTVIPGMQVAAPYTLLICLEAGIPFLCSSANDLSKIVAPEDIERVTFQPQVDLLFAKLADALVKPPTRAGAAVEITANGKDWQDWHQTTLKEARRNETSTPIQSASPVLPLVTVCMPHFNRPKYLRQAIASLVAQDYPHIELIVVDDGSTDLFAQNSLIEIERELADRGWALLRQKHTSAGAARNLAAKHARGEYLLFMDDDNCAKPSEISTFVKVALHTKADIVTCSIDLFSGDEAPQSDHEADLTRILLGPALAVGIFENVFGDTNALIKKEAFFSIGGHTDDAHTLFDDWEFYAKAVLHGLKLQVIPEPLFWYRQTGIRRTTLLSAYSSYPRLLRPYNAVVRSDLHELIATAQGLYFYSQEMDSRAQTTLANYEKLKETHNRFCDEVSEKLSIRRDTITQLESTIVELREELEKRSAILDKKRADVRRMDQHHQELQAALEHKNVECRESEKRVRDLQHEVLLSKSQLDSVQSSTSWKVTRPLRGLRAALKRKNQTI